MGLRIRVRVRVKVRVRVRVRVMVRVMVRVRVMSLHGTHSKFSIGFKTFGALIET